MDERRTNRIAESIRVELAQVIRFEMQDPRTAAVDVSRVDLAPDLSRAVIFISVLDQEETPHILRALTGARQFLKRALASRLRLRRVPELDFRADQSAQQEERMRILLDRARKWRNKVKEPPSEQETAE